MPEQIYNLFEEKGTEESSEEPSYARASILVPYPIDKLYSYRVPEGVEVNPGDYVQVPLGSRVVPAVAWDQPEGQDRGESSVSSKKVKDIAARYDMPPLPAVHRKFLEWVASYNCAVFGSVLKLTLSVFKALDPEKPSIGYQLTSKQSVVDADTIDQQDLGISKKQQCTPKQEKVLHVLSDGIARRPSEIAALAGCTAGVVTGLYKKGLLEALELTTDAPCLNPDHARPGPILSSAQQSNADCLQELCKKGGFHAALLDGVTGAGKTEVYFEAVAQALKQNKQVLILLPEIALSNAFLDRFQQRFGCAPALWHSALSPARRQKTWRGVAKGHTKVVIGARSALFLPFSDLGLIVVDEEHDGAYKQEEGVMYHARDMAVMRAHMGEFPIVMVSATPSLETIHNAWEGRYHHLELPDRHGQAKLPDIHVVDLKEDRPPRQHFIAPTIRDALEQCLENGEQSLLFLNRRGYAPLTICRACGHRYECPRCTAWMIEHRASQNLRCHHCDYRMPMPQACTECHEEDSLAACGPGVERIYEEVREYFPDARALVLASDTAENGNALRELLQDIREHKYDIIIGTQIIAKGHHFPKLTCIGVIDADLGLSGGDLRASERTYQLLHQVAGRAGREDLKGHVYLQSFHPENRVIQALASGERDEFLSVELGQRSVAQMPPFSRLAGIIVSGRDEQEVQHFAAELGKAAPQGEGLQIFGPAEAPFYRLRGKYRRRLLVQADKKLHIQKTILHWVNHMKIPSTVRVQVDIDPQSFM